MALNYTTYVAQLSNLMVVPSTDSNFTTFLPGCIDYAEQRLYRELDLLATEITDSTVSCSSGVRTVTLSTASGAYITLDTFSVLTPAGTGSSNGIRSPLVPVTVDFIDAVYPSAASAEGTPQFYALRSNTTVVLGPPPDDNYTIEVIGTQRPSALSASNSSTILTQYVPDLFMAASMVFASGYMRNFGSQADNPQMAQSWENQYQMLMRSALVEQARARFRAEGWTSQQPSQVATPPRV